eukprot:55391-Rhodomonas_salina.2
MKPFISALISFVRPCPNHPVRKITADVIVTVCARVRITQAAGRDSLLHLTHRKTERFYLEVRAALPEERSIFKIFVHLCNVQHKNAGKKNTPFGITGVSAVLSSLHPSCVS